MISTFDTKLKEIFFKSDKIYMYDFMQKLIEVFDGR